MAATKIPVVDDSTFTGADKGLLLPARRTAADGTRLQIANLDRKDPPDYEAGGVPRAPSFNANVVALKATPTMPEIIVECETAGFTPSEATPIFWRLQTLHVLARFAPKGHQHYGSRVVALDAEWSGAARANPFTLFRADADPPEVLYDNRDGRVAGGHAILTVAARPAPAGPWLQDFVHLRIVGTNPTVKDIRDLVKTIVADRGAAPFEAMLNAIFAWEAKSRQFAPSVQTRARYGPPGHKVLFDWPDDPRDFPVAAFDFGVGISQFTNPGKLRTWHAWDWRASIEAGANVFFDKLVASYSRRITWRAWALAAWEGYNGSGSAAKAYAKKLADTPDGATVPNDAVPDGFDLQAATNQIEFPEPPPPNWPVTRIAGVEIARANLIDDRTAHGAGVIGEAAARVAGDRQTLTWMWPRVVSDLHAQSEHGATHVLPGLAAAEVSAAVSGLNPASVDALANRSFAVAWRGLEPSLRSRRPVADRTPRRHARTIEEEWQSLSEFVRKNTGERKLADWARVRELMLKAFGARNDVDLAIKRINAYYDSFVTGQLAPGGVSMQVHAEMKARMDATQTLLTAKGSSDKLKLVADIGGFNIRPNANNPNQLSNHSFGIAIDLDPKLNPNMPLGQERATWTDLVSFLTGTDPYGEESKRLRSARPYDQSLPDAVALRQASAAYVTANAAAANLAAAVQAGFQRLLGLAISTTDVNTLLALAAPPHPDKAKITAMLTTLQVPAGKRKAMLERLIYAQKVFALAKKAILRSATGTAATTARFGFINLPAEVIAGLAASDGGKLRWLGSANATKDYMHFDFRDDEHPPLF